MESPPSTTVFLPAWNEAENLPDVVGDAVEFLAGYGGPFCVIIVDDGSTDNTSEVVDLLMAAHPGVVRSVCHDVNLGYGAALRSGFAAALDTGHDWIGFIDADGQFAPRDIGKLISGAQAEGTDMAIGIRIQRADKLHRRLMGRAWHHLSAATYHFDAADTDCGIKVFSRAVVEKMVPQLHGVKAEISPEMIAFATQHGIEFTEVPVQHYPRQHGKQSGGSPAVAIRSIAGLVIGAVNSRREHAKP